MSNDGRPLAAAVQDADGEIRTIVVFGASNSYTTWPLADAVNLSKHLNDAVVSAHSNNAALANGRAQALREAVETDAKSEDTDQDTGMGDPSESETDTDGDTVS